jgi:hypothetical protein
VLESLGDEPPGAEEGLATPVPATKADDIGVFCLEGLTGVALGRRKVVGEPGRVLIVVKTLGSSLRVGVPPPDSMVRLGGSPLEKLLSITMVDGV